MSATFRSFVAFLFFSALAAPFALTIGLSRGLSHDEHQHVAAGALLARQGLLPYLDYPYFHTPYLTLAYGILFCASDHLLLTARLFSVTCATAVAGLLGTVIFHAWRARSFRSAALISCSSVLLFLTTELFTRHTGRAGNQEPALLLAFAAFIVHCHGFKKNRPWLFVASGLLLGLAIGTRITFAPIVAPFGLVLLLHLPSARKTRATCYFSSGLTLGLIGLLAFFVVAPEQTFFGNFEFAKTNVLYRFATGEPRTMTILKKLRFLCKEVIRPNWPLVAIFGATLFSATRHKLGRFPFEVRFLILLLPFLLVGSFAPSPLFEQYFYPFPPFLILSSVLALQIIPERTIPLQMFASICLLFSAVISLRHYQASFSGTKEGPTLLVHRQGQQIRALVGQGKVLTLAPIYPLEAGLLIYPSFATGPFAWRISPYIDQKKARRLRIISPSSLEPSLDAVPPDAIFVGFEKESEEPLISYAKKHAYRRVRLWNKTDLWQMVRDKGFEPVTPTVSR